LLAFTSVYFSESSLFNGLGAKKNKKFVLFSQIRLWLRASRRGRPTVGAGQAPLPEPFELSFCNARFASKEKRHRITHILEFVKQKHQNSGGLRRQTNCAVEREGKGVVENAAAVRKPAIVHAPRPESNQSDPSRPESGQRRSLP
jgi:hypothetical protein